ncbi:hypothetical protein NDU88_005391 [Pleurodeles waltl]|uniref:Uncharacterized protein n=1 Tax=Pleurodeles waltl TaxID=8319 RepID=A0AAV7PIQ7_PLEWA|nr:hypothetical protein NDU88_005391 [Pleurodeles waltl]
MQCPRSFRRLHPGARNLLSRAGHQPSPMSRTLLPGRCPLARRTRGSELRPLPRSSRGRGSPPRGPWAYPQRGLRSHRHLPGARRRSRPLTVSPGDAAQLEPAASGPSSSAHRGRSFPVAQGSPGGQIPALPLHAGSGYPNLHGLSCWIPGRAVCQDLVVGPVGAVRICARHLGWVNHAP